MLKQRVVGWIDSAEWDAVYYNLYYGDGRHIQDALDQIAVWRARMGDRIPVAVESTACLFQCRIQGGRNDLMKQQGMAMAITQFVGLLTERFLRGCASNVPIHKRAQLMGIPEWVTNLRHEAAHGLLPSYEILSNGVDFALNWLKVFHWDEQYRSKCKEEDKKEESPKSTNVSKEDIATHLRDCISAVRKILPSKPNALRNFQVTILSKPVLATILSEVLVEYNFIPCYKGDETSPFYTKVRGQGLTINASIASLYKKIFTSLTKHGSINNVLAYLTCQLKSSSNSKELCCLWLNCVLDVLMSTNDSYECEFDWKALSQELQNHDVPSTLREKVANLSNLRFNYQPDALPESQPMDGITSDNATSKSLYHDGLNLSKCPLGAMPGQDARTLWQSLNMHSLPKAELSELEDLQPDKPSDEKFVLTPIELKSIAANIDLL